MTQNIREINKEMQKLDKEFDLVFGEPVADEYGHYFYEPSKGRRAGCDDCYINQKERAEHKEYLLSKLSELIQQNISHHNTTLKEIEEEIEKEFDVFWQHNFYDKGIQFTYLGKSIIGNHRIEHPKKTIKSFLRSLIHQKLIK